jgi:hypothetical protein
LLCSGVGHSSLQETWKEALDLVFNKSGFKPAIFTSHSKVSAWRLHAYMHTEVHTCMHAYTDRECVSGGRGVGGEGGIVPVKHGMARRGPRMPWCRVTPWPDPPIKHLAARTVSHGISRWAIACLSEP